MTGLLLGCIADDFTGATDLANNLVRGGMRVVQTIGVPTGPLDVEADAVVVSLKSRTIAADQAVAQSLEALHWLKTLGAKQIYFKYCSTFDSTPAGNIGPVTDALMTALDADFTIATPAFPDVGRTLFKGYLFVGDGLLNESGMQDHPLTPMRDPNLVRVLQSQTTRVVGLIDHTVVGAGASAIAERMTVLRGEGVGIAIVDATTNRDLIELARAAARLPLVTAGSGLAIGLPANAGLSPGIEASRLPAVSGHRAIVSGSCSRATNAQVADFIAKGGAAHAIDPLGLVDGSDHALVDDALAWATPRLAGGPVLVYSTAEPQSLREVQAALGVDAAGQRVEHVLSEIARGLVRAGVAQLVVAGGETSGAVVQALGIDRLQIGAQIDPGVPWCAATLPGSASTLHVALKSGNFGGTDFFTRAFAALDA